MFGNRTAVAIILIFGFLAIGIISSSPDARSMDHTRGAAAGDSTSLSIDPADWETVKALPAGSRIEIIQQDGSRAGGRLIRSLDESLTINRFTDKTIERQDIREIIVLKPAMPLLPRDVVEEEIAWGTYAGLICGIVAGLSASEYAEITRDRRGGKSSRSIKYGLLGYLAGVNVASPLVVYAIGRNEAQTGSFPATVAGGLLGGVVGVGLGMLTLGSWPSTFRFLAAFSMPAFGSSSGAAMGFNLTRHSRK